MSVQLLSLAKRFAAGELPAAEFANSFIGRWKLERDDGSYQNDADALSECLSSIFCLADLYHPAADRECYELDDVELREKVKDLVEQYLG